MDDHELELAESASTAMEQIGIVKQMVLDKEESEDDSPVLERFMGRCPNGSGSVFSMPKKSRVLDVL